MSAAEATAANLRCGFIGLGAMGAPMARHLAARGLLSALYNRSVATARQLAAELGVEVAADPASLAQQCDIVFLCVSADPDVRALVAALRPGLRPGMLVIDTSTVSAGCAREVASELALQGVDFLDAPLSGGVEGARLGRLSVMVGGDAQVLQCALPALESFAARIVHMGAVGAGQATKAVNQVMIAGIAEGVCEAMAFAQALDLPQDKLLQVLTGGAANSWFLEKRGASMLEGRFDSGFKLGLLHKDLGIVRSMAAALGAQLPSVEQALADYGVLKDENAGDDEISALIRLKQRLFAGR